MATQQDGKIIAAGFTDAAGGGDVALVRYQPNGALDRSFGDAGTVKLDFFGDEDLATSLLLQPDHRILVAGYKVHDGGLDFALARLNSDGSPDISFGFGGRAAVGFFGGDDLATSLAL